MSAAGGDFLTDSPHGDGGGVTGGHQGGGPGRGVNHPRLQGPGGGRRGVSFEDAAEYDFANNDRSLYGGDQYPLHCAFSNAEYKARRNSIFHPDGVPPTNNDARGSMPPPGNAWHGQQGLGLHPTMNLPGRQGEQGQSLIPSPSGERQMPMTGPQGQQGQPPAPEPPGGGGGQNITNAAAAPQVLAAQQGGAQIAVQPGGNNGAGVSQAVTGRVAQGTTSQEYLGISMALERLAQIITDADTSRNLCWLKAVAGDATKLALWKIEATSSPGLQFYAYMQPGEAFMVAGYSMSTIYSTMTDIATFPGKVVLFTGYCKRTRE